MAIAVGDIHGCLQPLRRLVERLPAGSPLVFLGDYVDRGPESAGVLRYLHRLRRERPCRFLRGNHEQMMADAVSGGGSLGAWLCNGGRETLRSYGLNPDSWRRQAERSGFLQRDEAFLSDLELYAEDEHAIYVHAGVDVGEPDMKRQDSHTLLWIREAFFRRARDWHGKPIVFGHTPTFMMGCGRGEVFRDHAITGIDTGCVYGGALTALDTANGRIYQEPGESRYA